jgi:Na+-transporting NADH:ubiquinone oxidoreductase subunit D
MSAEVLEQQVEEVKVEKTSEPLFSKKNRKLVSNPLDADNPITVQVLGICSALAVTVQMKPTIVMCIAVFAVMAVSSVMISILRNTIPGRIRIIVQLGVVASMVALVDQVLQAYAYEVSKQLSVFVGLIITNCIVMGRLEAFALGNKPWPSFLDAAGNALGYSAILITVAFFRELFGSGSIYGWKVFEAAGMSYGGNGVLVTPAGACIVLGLIIWAQRSRNGYYEEA